jgi:hypothetical protein
MLLKYMEGGMAHYFLSNHWLAKQGLNLLTIMMMVLEIET